MAGRGSLRADGGPRRNRVLALLPDADYERLLSKLEPVELVARSVVYSPDTPMEWGYFPLGSAASLVAFDAAGGAVEVGTVGREGMLGVPIILGGERTPMEALVQLGGSALRLPAAELKREYDARGPLAEVLGRYAAALFVQTSQSVACNRLHSLIERACRWLLTMHDRVDGDDLPLTHEFLGIMLGTARPKVTVALATLNRAGFISHQRGAVTVVDRPGLESASCECYGIIRTEFERLLGEPVR